MIEGVLRTYFWEMHIFSGTVTIIFATVMNLQAYGPHKRLKKRLSLSTIRKEERWLQEQWQLSNKGFKLEPKLKATKKRLEMCELPLQKP